MSSSFLTFYLCSFSCFSRGNVICNTFTNYLATCTIIGTADGATMPLITFYALAYVLSYSLLTLEHEAPPCLTLFFFLRTHFGNYAATFFLFSNDVYISSLVLFTLGVGFYGFSFWWTNIY